MLLKTTGYIYGDSMNTRWIQLPSKIRLPLQLIRGIFFQYGWLKSLNSGKPVGKDGEPVPWFSYPAIDFLKQFDFFDKTVFEWGAGQSTIFWSARAKRVVSVESDPKWYGYLKPRLAENCELMLRDPDNASYIPPIEQFPEGFDVIVIDGTWLGRLAGSKVAPRHLKDGGMIILDNSDQCLESAQALRDAGLTEIDFTGFVPGSGYACTTSIFFNRLSFPALVQPRRSVAQPNKPWADA